MSSQATEYEFLVIDDVSLAEVGGGIDGNQL